MAAIKPFRYLIVYPALTRKWEQAWRNRDRHSTAFSPAAARHERRNHMVKWAGWMITLAGVGHTLGSLIETVPNHLGTWFDGSLWSETDYAAFSDAAAGFWYSAFSFGPPLLLIGVTLLWMERRGVTPPPFIAWAIASWVIVTFVASGPSPLPILLVASGLLIAAARRAKHALRQSTPGNQESVGRIQEHIN
jgi:hypothetical protein